MTTCTLAVQGGGVSIRGANVDLTHPMKVETVTPSPGARRIARTILNGFDAYFADYQNLTLGAKRRFEAGDWVGVHEASQERLDLYKFKVNQVLKLIRGVTNKEVTDMALWREARFAYAQLVRLHHNYEIAETFFNSIFCALFDHRSIHDRNVFVLPSRDIDDKPVPEYSIYFSYRSESGIVDLVDGLLDDFAFSVSWENKRRDVSNIVRAIQQQVLPNLDCPLEGVRIDMLESVFYRNKGAYLVGRAVYGEQMLPIILPCLNNESGGMYIDTIIVDADSASVIFSFTRSYFFVDTAMPSRFVRFLLSIMPNKTLSELYNSIGFNKHGKTEFYRAMVRHLRGSTDPMIVAPGIKGMVMTVFTLPSYDCVFKVIKDRFDPPKTVTEEIVRDKYRFVSRSDRAGRMADTQEYSNFIFYRNRFSEELLAELLKVAPSKLIVEDKHIVVRHLYAERRMIPLNLYLRDASEVQVSMVMDEYGNSIKQMAAANIFPGDMLLKNFGVTRHGRVVFYDYDEICPLTDCNFRKLPVPRTEEEEMSGEPWYAVAENDVFPEEFCLFFSGNPKARAAFEEQHGDLYEPLYWQQMQKSISEGLIFDAFPYRRSRAFPSRVRG